MKVYLKHINSNSIFNGEMLKTFPVRLGSPASFHIVLEVLDNKRRKRIKGTKIINEHIKLLLFAMGMIVYVENRKPSTDKILELELF